ncbi:MAG: DUF4293 domain-containing protein [Paludibacteraceae bacterium]|nr:DUF4293 domain-containing protein [Paludibacteraceae bacterium]
MIQRIQSIYLLIVTILSIVICLYPYASINGAELTYTTSIIYAGLATIIPVTTLFTIFLFRKRILQMRLCSFACIVMLFQAGYMLASYFIASDGQAEGTCHLYLPAVVPYINIILTYLAIRGIGKDEAMVRAADRLR